MKSDKRPLPWWLTPMLLMAVLAAALLVWPRVYGFLPVYLKTDVLLFVLVAVAAFMIAYIRRHEHLREPWRRVFRRRLAMGAAVVLCAYVAVGLLDSVHFREPLPMRDNSGQVDYSVQVLSLFDLLTTPMRTHIERTYSAPFATRLFSKESVEHNGKAVRIYPRLKYGGAALSDPATQELPDIAHTVLWSIPQGLLIWGVLAAVVVGGVARRHGGGWRPAAGRVFRQETELPWHVTLYTALVLILLITAAAHLSVKYHVFGTDKVGNDVFYQTLKSIRTGLVIGTLSTLIMLPFAIMLGITAGYFKGWVDDVVQYVYTTLNSIPGILLIAAAILSIQVYIANHPGLYETAAGRADLRLLALCGILGVTSWTSLCRLLRGEALKISQLDYIEAATAFGVRHAKILRRHILPNVMHIVLIVVVLDFSGLVLAEAVLSYVGVGVDPSTNSWGNMINGARLEMAREPMVWWSLAAAFVFMLGLVLAANLFADAVRDAFDPRFMEKN